MLVGYARVSTLDQNPSLQTDALHAAGCKKLFVGDVIDQLDIRRTAFYRYFPAESIRELRGMHIENDET